MRTYSDLLIFTSAPAWCTTRRRHSSYLYHILKSVEEELNPKTEMLYKYLLLFGRDINISFNLTHMYVCMQVVICRIYKQFKSPFNIQVY